MGIPLSGISPTLGVPAVGDQANAVISGNFTASGVSSAFVIYGAFNAFLWGNGGPNGAWNGTVQLERSFDGGTTWLVCGVGGGGTQAVYTTATGADVSIGGAECERGMAYRWHCTNFVSGPIFYRISTTGVLGTTNGIPA